MVVEIISILSSIIVAILSAYITISVHRSNSRNQQALIKTEKKLDVFKVIYLEKRQRLDIQLSEFYDPLFALLSVNHELLMRAGPPSSMETDSPNIQQEKREVWDRLAAEVILPNNKRICDIIEQKLHLITSSDDATQYFRFLTHAYVYHVFRDFPHENYLNFQFPQGFLEHVQLKREEIRATMNKIDPQKPNNE
ncbi:MAG TPA: hypothetical protein PKD09_22020 [Aggregatilinea sp.]|uniref:hypothetical protein n=1 Tax=Aggregatilinea sp. TaxID=2806333 RepID=UPI002BA9D551|nr:hypothetical protein [Aggregatilinea sp.]HML24349.1 hypothetical protein [Aggregatilinea sp.]